MVKESDISVSPGPRISDLGEFALIARLRERFPAGQAVLLGPGDDAAVVQAPDGRVVATTDLLVDGVHFDRSWSSGYHVGRRAAAANLADVAAMGAAPTALLVGLAAPGNLELRWAEQLADGLAAEAAIVGCAIAGGDVVRSDQLTVAVTALGDLAGRDPVRRGGARIGDAVLLAGRLGWAAAGLDLLRAGLDPAAPDGPAAAALLAAHRQPSVCYGAAALLAECHANSMIDVSDGLAGDAAQLAAESRVALQISLAALTIDEPLQVAARRLGVDPLAWVLGGGDDHAFLVTLADADAALATRRIGELAPACPVRRIGRVLAGTGVHWTDGTAPELRAHEHFREGVR